MDASAFDTTGVVRPALLTIFLYLFIFVMALMAMTKHAHASGAVNPTSGWCSNIYDPSTCIYSTELEACTKLASMQAECKYSPHIAHYHGSEIAGDACFANNSSGVECFYSWSGLGWMGRGSVCPAHTTLTSPPCGCADPYQPDASGTSCILPNNCPANMSGSPCACDTGYVLNSGEAGCVLEQFTISEPLDQSQLPDVEPGSTSEVTVRVTSVQTSQPKQGAVVRFHIDVDISSGGHAHGEERGRRPRGTISSNNCVSEPGDNTDTYDCTTGPLGYTGFTFNAPDISGKQTITATCISAQCNGSITDNIDVKVPDLISIPDDPALYALIGGETGKQHHDNHYLTSSALDQLFVLVINYHVRYPNEPVLHLNDASLVWGGKFDINGNWVGSHKGHKRGTVIDIRANTAEGNIPESLFDDFKNLAASTQTIVNGRVKSAIAKVHCSRGRDPAIDNCVGDDNRHFHVILLGVDQ